jgi:hypothetical protein
MRILVLNNSILAAGEFTETATEITTADAIYPKHVITGYQIIEAELPADYAPGRYTYDGEFVRVPVDESEQNAAHNALVFEQINALELKQPRAVREALLGMEGAVGRLQTLEDDIAALRVTLK